MSHSNLIKYVYYYIIIIFPLSLSLNNFNRSDLVGYCHRRCCSSRSFTYPWSPKSSRRSFYDVVRDSWFLGLVSIVSNYLDHVVRDIIAVDINAYYYCMCIYTYMLQSKLLTSRVVLTVRSSHCYNNIILTE